MRYHDPLQHHFLFFAPALKVEELVHETGNIAKKAIFDLEKEFSLNDVA